MSNVEHSHVNYTPEEIANDLRKEVEDKWQKELHDLIEDSIG